MHMSRIFSNEVLERAKRLPDIMPEPFKALEEYDRTLKLRRWDNKVRVNFTLDPAVYQKFRDYCAKEGYKMSTLVERIMKMAVNDAKRNINLNNKL